MEKKLCVFLPETDYKLGDRVFWFDHPDTEDVVYNNEYVRVYDTPESKTPCLRCHISKIQEVSQSTTEIKMGKLYLKEVFSQFNK